MMRKNDVCLLKAPTNQGVIDFGAERGGHYVYVKGGFWRILYEGGDIVVLPAG